jgi:hypothetical protein
MLRQLHRRALSSTSCSSAIARRSQQRQHHPRGIAGAGRRRSTAAAAAVVPAAARSLAAAAAAAASAAPGRRRDGDPARGLSSSSSPPQPTTTTATTGGVVGRPFDKVMAANRGEIATRILRAASELGCGTVGIYSREGELGLPSIFLARCSVIITTNAMATMIAMEMMPGLGLPSLTLQFAIISRVVFFRTPLTMIIITLRTTVRRNEILHNPIPRKKKDRFTQHRYKADQAFELNTDKSPVAAYLDIDTIVRLCVQNGVQAVHPGYGFLSENANFARKLEEAGVRFVGPTVENL